MFLPMAGGGSLFLFSVQGEGHNVLGALFKKIGSPPPPC